MAGRRSVAVITGGAGGMGLATARILGHHHRLLLSDVSEERLTQVVADLAASGYEAEGLRADVADKASVDALAARAAAIGPVAAVVHTAGVSPQMKDAESIVRINALGTVHVSSAFLALAAPGSRIVNVASMAGHMLPKALVPTRAFKTALTDPEVFVRKVMRRINVMPAGQRPAMAYPISKQFVVWYSKRMAAAFGERGAGIVSVSPGSIDTEMGRLEADHGAAAILRFAALKRFGAVDEIAEVLAFCASDRAGYLTGTDILCDGGVIAGIRRKDMVSVAKER
jgi:NAD(P)-dependent dehydrogenase (short-subunit alcohol dehydrogenase family)